jgi:hypothetical protein
MDNVTYEAYRSNPAVREQLEREAREERRREVQRLMVAPVVRWIKHAFTGAQPASERTPPSMPPLQI